MADNRMLSFTAEQIDMILAAAAKRSNRNLLDNWYFANPVDQRGGYVVPPNTAYYSDTGLTTQVGTVNAYTKVLPFNGTYGIITVDSTTYYVAWSNAVRGYTGPYGTYTIDRWFITSPTMALLVNSDCISFVDTKTDVQVRQKLEEGILESGRTYTISALVKASSACTLKLVMNSSNGYYGGEYHNIGTEYVLVTHSFVCDGGSNQTFCIADHATNVKYSIKAAKLELGSQQTLAHQDENGNWVLNEIPDYGEQLARCQRVLLPVEAWKCYSGRIDNEGTAYIEIPTPVSMRSGDVPVIIGAKNGLVYHASGLKDCTYGVVSFGANSVTISASGFGITNQVCSGCFSNKVFLSKEL